MSSIKENIWQVVAAIPEGTVTSYGEVAKLAGYSGYARYVGATLKALPDDTKLPWHRVLNAKGEIVFPENSAAFSEQRQRLIGEGIYFLSAKRVDLKRCRWCN